MEEEANKLNLDLTRDLEQMEAGAVGYARVVALFFHELIEQKVTRAEATVLTGIWVQSTINASKK